RLETGLRRQLPKDQERARTRQRAAARVQEQLRAMPAVEMGPPAREVAAKRLDRGPADRDDPLLVSFADDADETLVEVDAFPVETGPLADRRRRDGTPEPSSDMGQIAPIRLDRPRRPWRGEQREEPLYLRVGSGHVPRFALGPQTPARPR